MHLDEFKKLSHDEKLRIIARMQADGTAASGGPMQRHPHLLVDPNEGASAFPLTDLQEAYLAAKVNPVNPDRTGCHVYLEFELDDVDRMRLHQAWSKVVSVHPMLHAKVLPNGTQCTVDHAPPSFVNACDGLEGPALEAVLAATRAEMSHKLYKPNDWPLYEIRVTPMPGGRARIHVSMDAWIADAHSAEHIYALWRQAYRDSSWTPPPIGLRFRDVVHSLRAFRGSPGHLRSIEYWRNRLRAAPHGPALPSSEAGLDSIGESRRERLRAHVPTTVYRALNESFERQGISASAGVLTLFCESLRSWSGNERFGVVLTLQNRPPLHPEMVDVVGPCTSSVLFDADVEPGESVGERAARYASQLFEALDHGLVGLVEALRSMGPERPDRHYPVVFSSLLSAGESVGWMAEATHGVSQTPGTTLHCQVRPGRGGMDIILDGVPTAFDQGFFGCLLEHFQALLEAAAMQRGCWNLAHMDDEIFPRTGGMPAPAPTDALVPMTSLQLGYLSERIRAPDRASGYIFRAFRLDALDPGMWQRAIDSLLADHPMLRAKALDQGGFDCSDTVASYVLPTRDVDSKPDFDVEAASMLEEFRTERRWPGFRLRLLREVGQGGWLLSVLDMARFDAWSAWSFYAELIGRGHGEKGRVESPAWRSFLISRATPSTLALHERYWIRRLAALPGAPSLPCTGATIAASSPHATFQLVHTVADIRNLLDYSAKKRTSLEAIVLAAYAMTLATDDAPFALGVVDYGLRYAHGQHLEGFGDGSRFAWVDTAVDGQTDLLACARRFQRQLSRDRMHAAAAPFKALRTIAANGRPLPTRDIVMTSCLDAPSWTGAIEVDAISDTPGVTLDNMVHRRGNSLAISWVLRRNGVDFPAMFRRFRSFTAWLDALAGDPEAATRRTAAPTGKPDGEHHKRLAEWARWNDTDRDYDRDVCLHTLFERCAAAQPFAVATICDDEALTYQELDRRANRLANRLQALGVGRGRQVALMLPRDNQLVISALAILKCGGAFVPINVDDPRQRIERVLGQAEATLVISITEHYGRFDDATRHVVLLDAEASAIAALPHEFQPKAKVRADDRAYVIFTSGSTGTPKGVMVSHRPVVNLIEWAKREFGFTASDRVLFVNPLSFDLSIFDLFGMLAYGASIRIVGDADRTNALAVATMLADEPITFWNSAPAYLQMLLPFLQGGSNRVGTLLARVRLVFLSGDWIPLEMPDAMRHVAPNAKLISLGGATEATVWSNYFPVDRLDPTWRSIPYGRPIQNARYYIVDEHLNPVAVGEDGDLFIGGECLSDGYINEPELTARAFVHDPFHETSGAIMYRTGDRARFFADGNIEFLGRQDHQVKLRGYRVELGEVEAALEACGLARAIAAVRDDQGGRRLIAFAPALGGMPPGELADAAMLDAIRQRLPAYMLPSCIVILPALPITGNGKIDRKRLAQDSLASLGARESSAEPTAESASGETAPPFDRSALDEALARWLAKTATGIIGSPATTVGLDDNLGQIGFNSLHYTLLGAALANELGVAMNPALFFRYVSVAEIRDYLLHDHAETLARALNIAEVAASGTATPTTNAANDPLQIVAVPAHRAGAVAVIGMAGAMPCARDLDAFWLNLCAGRDCTSEIPAERWDWRSVEGDPQDPGNRTRVHRAAFMDDVASFDAAFFSISPREAELMDPRQRLLLETVWACLEDAGVCPSDLRGAPVGLFVGATGDEYASLSLESEREIDRFTLSGVSRTILANRVSYLYDWHGPSEVVDTACSSSLVAIHNAVRAIQAGDCTIAIAGGINVIIDPVPHICLDKIGMLAPDGRCKTFDASADGYARGEGVGLVLLKPLTDALRDGDTIHAVIRGTAVNHGGRATALTAPNPIAQIQVIRKALDRSGLDISRVGYIETHGTGTVLGDPIEMEALKEAFTALAAEQEHPCPAPGSVTVSSVKPNIGHLESAAGVAGFLKALLCVKHGFLPATLHLNRTNPHIDLDGSPFRIVREAESWPQPAARDGAPQARAAGISSFGFGGVNAHVIVEQHLGNAPTSEAPTSWLVPISAQDESQLALLAARLADRLDENPTAWRLADVAYTLQVGRQSLKERALLKVDSISGLATALRAMANGLTSDAIIWRGDGVGTPWRAKRRTMPDAPDAPPGTPEAQIARWLAINEAAWPHLPQSAPRDVRRVALPTYPFARTPYWLPPLRPASSIPRARLIPHGAGEGSALTIDALAPLVAAHRIADQAVLPAAAYLALLHERAGAKTVRFTDIVWMQPFALAEGERTLCLEMAKLDDGRERITFHSLQSGRRIDHCSADWSPASAMPAPIPTIPAPPAGERAHADAGACLAAFSRNGIALDTPYRSVTGLSFAAKLAEATLDLAHVSDVHERWLVALDGALQTIALHQLMTRPDSPPRVPFHIRSVTLAADCPPRPMVRAALSQGASGQPSRLPRYDVEIVDDAGLLLARLETCTGKEPSRPKDETQHTLHYRPRWEPVIYDGTGPAGIAALWLCSGDHPSASPHQHVEPCDEAGWFARMSDGKTPDAIVMDFRGRTAANDLFVPFDQAFAVLRAAMRARLRRPLSIMALHEEGGETFSAAAVRALGALGRVARNESPNVRMVAVAVLGSRGKLDLSSLAARIGAIPANSWRPVNYRFDADSGELSAERMIPLSFLEREAPTLSVGSVVAISGGAGGIGRLLARFLLARGCRVALLGRKAEALVMPVLRESGLADHAGCRYICVDVTSDAALEIALESVRRTWGPLRAVFHAAGVHSAGMLMKRDVEAARAAVETKIVGAVALDRATREDPLEHFMAFSSLASWLGPVGQADYAYANAFLNAFAQTRNGLVRQGSRSGITQAVDWPLWLEGGMRMDEREREYIAREQGMVGLPTDAAMRCLTAILGGGYESVAVAVGDKRKIDLAMLGAATP